MGLLHVSHDCFLYDCEVTSFTINRPCNKSSKTILRQLTPLRQRGVKHDAAFKLPEPNARPRTSTTTSRQPHPYQPVSVHCNTGELCHGQASWQGRQIRRPRARQGRPRQMSLRADSSPNVPIFQGLQRGLLIFQVVESQPFFLAEGAARPWCMRLEWPLRPLVPGLLGLPSCGPLVPWWSPLVPWSRDKGKTAGRKRSTRERQMTNTCRKTEGKKERTMSKHLMKGERHNIIMTAGPEQARDRERTREASINE